MRQRPGHVALDRVRDLHAQGLTVREIAETLGCSLGPVYERLKEARLKANLPAAGSKPHLERPDISDDTIRDLREQGLSIPEVAAELRCTQSLVKWRCRQMGATSVQLRKRYRKDITPQAVLAAHESGMTWAEMTAFFQCSDQTILNRLRAAGFSRRREVDLTGLERPLQRPDVTAEECLEKYSQGLTLREVAEQMETTGTTVSNRIRPRGVIPDPNRRSNHAYAIRTDVTVDEILAAVQAGFSRREIALRLNCGVDLITDRLRQIRDVSLPRSFFRRGISIEVLTKGWQDGLSAEEIAHRLGCTAETIKKRLRRAGFLEPTVRLVRRRLSTARESGASPDQSARPVDHPSRQ